MHGTRSDSSRDEVTIPQTGEQETETEAEDEKISLSYSKNGKALHLCLLEITMNRYR